MTIQNLDIRERTQDQLPISVNIHNASMPADAQITLEEVRANQTWDRPDAPPLRLIAWIDGQPVASGSVVYGFFNVLNRHSVNIHVIPEFRRQGIARTIYRRLLEYARVGGAAALQAHIHQDNLPLVQEWLLREDFREAERMRPSELALEDMNFDAWEWALQRVADEGFRLTTLAAEDAEANRRQLWELTNLVRRDVPHDAHEDMPFDRFVETLERPDSLPDCLVIAAQGERYVGFSILVHMREGLALTGLTGVHPDYRNRGIALAIKVLSAQLARQHGYHAMRTANHVNNPPMLAVNNRLGYKPLPETSIFVKELKL